MPEVTTCPDCEKKLKVPDTLIGKKVRCPGCSTMFLAKADGAEQEVPPLKAKVVGARNDAISSRRDDPPPRHARDDDDDRRRPRDDYDDRDRDRDRDSRRRDDDYDDRPSRRSRRDDYYDDDYDRRPSRSSQLSAWKGTRMGVFLVIIANWLYLATFGIGALGTGIMMLAGATMLSSMIGGGPMNEQRAGQMAGGAIGMGIAAFLFMGLLGFLWFAGMVMQIVGTGICMQVPAHRSGAMRGMAIAAFSCLVAGLVIGTGGYLAGIHSISGSVNGLLNLGAFVCWILFLCFIAWDMKDNAVASRLITYMIVYLVFALVVVPLIAVLVVCGGVASVASSQNADAAASRGTAMMVVGVLVGGFLTLAFLGLEVWYIFLMQQVKALIDRKISRL